MRASAYTFDDGTKAYVSMRMTVQGTRPIYTVSDDGVVKKTSAERVSVAEFKPKVKFLKLKFMLYMHVWMNIDDEDVVKKKRSNSDAFVEYISDMYEDLGMTHYYLN